MDDEQQAHAMSHPDVQRIPDTDEAWDERKLGADERFAAVAPDSTSGGRQHVSDGAYAAYVSWPGVEWTQAELEMDARECGYVMLTVAEHDELCFGVSRQAYDYLGTLCQKAQDDRDALRAEVERLRVQVAGMTGQAEGYRQVIGQLSERLRKGRDETVNNSGFGNSCAVGGALSVAGNQLDPRLGMPQPEGEPCEPMSARSWRRRSGE